MRKFLFLAVILLAALSSASAAPAESLSPEQALSRARRWANHVAADEQAPLLSLNSPSASLRLAMTGRCPQSGRSAYYVYDRPEGGFVILSADSDQEPVIGWSATACFSPKNMPAALEAMLSNYAALMGCDALLKEESGTPALFDREEIAPITSSLWGQGWPYNEQCPEVYNLYITRYEHAATGCVATAMAQVMRAHSWPLQASGLTSASPLRWDLMRDTYPSGPDEGEYSQECADAVAYLMAQLGESVDMYYGLESSSSLESAAQAFTAHFGYDGNLFVYSGDYSPFQWFDLAYGELSQGSPILYRGTDADQGSGHAFVADGWRKGNYFHINWGWNGRYDGWYHFSALAPNFHTDEGSASVVGAGAGNYSFGQAMMLRTQPLRQGSGSMVVPVEHLGFHAPDETHVSLTYRGAKQWFYGGALTEGPTDLGLMAVSLTDGTIAYAKTGEATYGNYSKDVSVADVELSAFGELPDGLWRIYPVTRPSGAGSRWFMTKIGSGQEAMLPMTVTGGVATMQSPADATVEMTDFSSLHPICVGSTADVTFTLTALHGDYRSNCIVYLGNDQRSFNIGTLRVSLMEGESLTFTVQGEVDSRLTPGPGFIRLTGSGLDCSREVTILEGQTGTPEIALAEPLVIPSRGNVTADVLCVTAKLSCSGGTFCGTIDALLYPFRVDENGWPDWEASTGRTSAWTRIEEGAEENVTFEIPTGTLEDDALYLLSFYYTLGNSDSFTYSSVDDPFDDSGYGYNSLFCVRAKNTLSLADTKELPDAGFRRWLAENVDAEGDGILTNLEMHSLLSTFGYADLTNGYQNDITMRNITGIHHFPYITMLNASGLGLESADVTGLPFLTVLQVQDNALTSLDLSGCPRLQGLECHNNHIAALDISQALSWEYTSNQYVSLPFNAACRAPLSSLTALGVDTQRILSMDNLAIEGNELVAASAALLAANEVRYTYSTLGGEPLHVILTRDVAGVDDLDADASDGLIITTAKGIITVSGATGTVTVTDVTGRLIHSGACGRIAVGAPGVYLVKAPGHRAVKVAVP